MSTKKREIVQRNPVTILPKEVVVEAGNWEGSSLFTVHNSADAVLCQIRVKITVDHPHIRIRDFTVESPKPTGELLSVGQIGISGDFMVLPGRLRRKKASYCHKAAESRRNLPIHRYRRSPYVPTGQYALLCLSVLGLAENRHPSRINHCLGSSASEADLDCQFWKLPP
jgi:hypothetical protein